LFSRAIHRLFESSAAHPKTEKPRDFAGFCRFPSLTIRPSPPLFAGLQQPDIELVG
jgi:hypothetical protein